MSASTPPSITSKPRRLAGWSATDTGGFSNPSRVPRTLLRRRMRNMAMPARTRSCITAELMGNLAPRVGLVNVVLRPYVRVRPGQVHCAAGEGDQDVVGR